MAISSGNIPEIWPSKLVETLAGSTLGAVRDAHPVPMLDDLIHIAATRDGYLFMPAARNGERPSLSDARHASTPQELGEKIATWIVARMMDQT